MVFAKIKMNIDSDSKLDRNLDQQKPHWNIMRNLFIYTPGSC